jgi:hypothetical protein
LDSTALDPRCTMIPSNDHLARKALAADPRIARERTERVKVSPGYSVERTVPCPVRELAAPDGIPDRDGLGPWFVLCECQRVGPAVTALDEPLVPRRERLPTTMERQDWGLRDRDVRGVQFAYLARVYVGQCPACSTVWWRVERMV